MEKLMKSFSNISFSCIKTKTHKKFKNKKNKLIIFYRTIKIYQELKLYLLRHSLSIMINMCALKIKYRML